MNRFFLSEIYIYPIKSLGGISLQEAQMEERGLRFDRRWMLIDDEGIFITQRKHPILAHLTVRMLEEQIIIEPKSNTQKSLSFNLSEQLHTPITVTVWNDTCTAFEVSTLASQWFSDFLAMPVRLIKMCDLEKRAVDHQYASKGEIVSFADGYPTLIIGQSSLDGLNERLTEPVGMNRFRPNLVFTGGAPHVEDTFANFSLGGVDFSAVKPCARCVLITVNPETAQKGTEPLKTLAKYRTSNQKVMFGQNLLHTGQAKIRVGDELHVNHWKMALTTP